LSLVALKMQKNTARSWEVTQCLRCLKRCAGFGLDGVNFLHSSLYGAVF